jgi:thiol-disulfide isomerase/thioredoxin
MNKPNFKTPLLICLLLNNLSNGFSQNTSINGLNCKEKLSEKFTLLLSLEQAYYGRAVINYYKAKGISHSDTSVINNGDCLFSGTVSEPTFLYIEFLDMPSGLKEFKRTCILTKGDLRLKIEKSGKSESIIQGSLNDSAFLDYINSINPLDKKLRELEKFEDSPEANISVKDSIVLIKNLILNSAVEKFYQYKDYWISAHILYSHQYDLPPEKLKHLFSILPDEVKCSLPGIEVSNLIQRQVGKIAPNFSAISSKGVLIELNQISHSNKMTVLYFWASWCKPCKALLPHLDTLHKSYEKMGFSIIAIANDDERKEKWINLIKELNIDYMHHVLQRFGKEDDIGRLYAIMAIPVVILVDNEGKIIYRLLGTEIQPMRDFIDEYFHMQNEN